MRFISFLYLIFLTLMLGGCGTTDAQLVNDGRSLAYIDGFHDGRHSGIKEAGNRYEHYIRDEERFAGDADYQAGWLAGETEGKRLQSQAVGAGKIAADVYQAEKVIEEVDKQRDFGGIAEGAASGTDAEALKSLE